MEESQVQHETPLLAVPRSPHLQGAPPVPWGRGQEDAAGQGHSTMLRGRDTARSAMERGSASFLAAGCARLAGASSPAGAVINAAQICRCSESVAPSMCQEREMFSTCPPTPQHRPRCQPAARHRSQPLGSGRALRPRHTALLRAPSSWGPAFPQSPDPAHLRGWHRAPPPPVNPSAQCTGLQKLQSLRGAPAVQETHGAARDHQERTGRRRTYLDVVEGRFVGDIVEQEQGCRESRDSLVLAPCPPPRAPSPRSAHRGRPGSRRA